MQRRIRACHESERTDDKAQASVEQTTSWFQETEGIRVAFEFKVGLERRRSERNRWSHAIRREAQSAGNDAHGWNCRGAKQHCGEKQNLA